MNADLVFAYATFAMIPALMLWHLISQARHAMKRRDNMVFERHWATTITETPTCALLVWEFDNAGLSLPDVSFISEVLDDLDGLDVSGVEGVQP